MSEENEKDEVTELLGDGTEGVDPRSYYNTLWMPEIARATAHMGGTEADIARELQVSTKTLFNWRQKYPVLNQAVREGKAVADSIVANSLYTLATGFGWEETETTTNAKGEVTRTKTRRGHTAPNVAAVIFWLKNRRPDLWADVQEHKFSAALTGEGDQSEEGLKVVMSIVKNPPREIAPYRESTN